MQQRVEIKTVCNGFWNASELSPLQAAIIIMNMVILLVVGKYGLHWLMICG